MKQFLSELSDVFNFVLLRSKNKKSKHLNSLKTLNIYVFEDGDVNE